MISKKKNIISLLAIALSIVFSSQQICAQVDEVSRRASINPSIITLETDETAKFKIIKKATIREPKILSTAVLAENVKWSVNGIVGGNEEFGKIDKNGRYTAPSEIPTPGEIHIMGEIEGVQNEKLFATVLIEPHKNCYESVYQYSEPRKESKYFDNPHGVALDKEGNLIIADVEKHHVVRFSREGRFLGYIGEGPGQENGQFHRPRVVLIDKADGDIYVSDQKNFGNRIQIFTNDGEFKKSFGLRGRARGEFLRIHGMEFDSKGNLYVVDVDNYRITKFSHEGEFISSTWGKKGIYGDELNEPHGLVVGPNNDVFVSSYYGTIKKFDANGNYLLSFAEADPPNGSMYIHAISDDKWGNIYSMVRGINGFGGQFEKSRNGLFSIEKYNNQGDFLCGINLSLSAHSEIWAAIDNKDGYIYAIYRTSDAAGFEVLAPK